MTPPREAAPHVCGRECRKLGAGWEIHLPDDRKAAMPGYSVEETAVFWRFIDAGRAYDRTGYVGNRMTKEDRERRELAWIALRKASRAWSAVQDTHRLPLFTEVA